MKSSAVLLLTLLLQTGSGQGYKWPTDASTALTSSFGEFRPRHYHAAIDIKTWNRTGYRIFAIDDGYIMRARISAFGYGKALYLKLKDGNIVVYAHLSNFWPELESYMDNYRREKRIYEADLHFTSGQFPVKKGQTLGRTGRTGIGYPHLHFEIRNPNNMPVNPLQYYPNTIKDNIPPRLYEVALFPHDHKSTLNLKTDTLFYPLNGDHTVSLRDTLLLSGKICLALKVYDQADGVSNRFSFYQSRMWIDDSLVYSVKYDIFSYALSYKVELDKNFSQWRKGNGIFHNYYRHRLNNLPHYGSTPGEGGIINTALLTEGIHDLKIEITDFAGNISLFEMSFFSGEIPVLHYDLLRWLENDLYLRLQTSEKMDSILVQSKSKDGKWTSEKINRSVSGPTLNETYQYTFSVSPSQPSQTEWLKIYGRKPSGIPSFPIFIAHSPGTVDRTNSKIIELLQLEVKKNWLEFKFFLNYPDPVRFLNRLQEEVPEIMWFPLDKNSFQINWPVESAFSQRLILEKLFELNLNRFTLVSRETRTNLISEDGLFRAEFPVNSLYNQVVVHLEERIDSSETSQVTAPYQSIGKLYDLKPFDQPVDAGIWISLSSPDTAGDPGGLGLYYLDKKGWTFIAAAEESNPKKFSSRVTSMEKFTLIRDTIPPVVMPLQPVKNKVIISRNGMVSFMVKDEMCGIRNESQINFYINGNWQLFDFDPEEDVVTLSLHDDIRKPAALLIEVEDNCGNTTLREYIIQ